MYTVCRACVHMYVCGWGEELWRHCSTVLVVCMCFYMYVLYIYVRSDMMG